LEQPLGESPNAQRIAIVDLDLHHGNGTQDIYWERDDVFYISTHQSPLYPGTGSLRETGAGAGEGWTANFPLPPGTGDEGFTAVMEKLILPLLNRFSPQMILVSFGFDPHWHDPLGHLQLSAEGYGGLIAALTNWAEQKCDGKIALFLEGGYDLEAGSACIQACVAALLNETWQDPIGPAPRPGKSWQALVRDALALWEIKLNINKNFPG
jgi:acetoin utilization deacetylase AcuC-like enzyme